MKNPLKECLSIGWVILICCSCQSAKTEHELDFKVVGEKVRASLSSDLARERTTEVGKCIVHLMDENKLPGYTNGEHGTLSTENYDLMVDGKVVKVTYPISQTFRWVKLGEASTNNYTLQKMSKKSLWQLKRAWKTDSNGNVVHEWLVPQTKNEPYMPTIAHTVPK